MSDEMAERMRRRRQKPRTKRKAPSNTGLPLLLIAAGTAIAGIAGTYLVLDNRLDRIEEASQVLETQIAEAKELFGHEMNVSREELAVRIDHSEEQMREDFSETWKVLKNEVAARPTENQVARAIADSSREFRTADAIDDMIRESIDTTSNGLSALITSNSERIELASADRQRLASSLSDAREIMTSTMVTREEFANLGTQLESTQDGLTLLKENSIASRKELLADVEARFEFLLDSVDQVEKSLSEYPKTEEVATLINDRTTNLVDAVTHDQSLAEAEERSRAMMTREAQRQAKSLIEPVTSKLAEMQSRITEAGQYLDENMATKDDLKSLREEIAATTSHTMNAIANEFLTEDSVEDLITRVVKNARTEFMALIDEQVAIDDKSAEPLAAMLDEEPTQAVESVSIGKNEVASNDSLVQPLTIQ